MDIKSFKQLKVWQKSIALTKEIYIVTREFPKSELYGLVAQMRRAAVSIASNIAEGYRRTSQEYVRFLRISYGSASELETQVTIAKNLYPNIDFSKIESYLDEIQKMLYTMIKKINKK